MDVDLHFHLLPGVDDGPATMADALELAAAAAAAGTRTIVVTPHVRRDFLTSVRDLPDRLQQVRRALDAEGIALDLRCGAELGHDMVHRLRQRDLELVAQGPPGARWLLVETPFEQLGAEFHAATDELRARGFAVLLGHPERSADAALDGAQGLRRELGLGARAQVNALSLAGRHGADAEAAAHRLVAAGLVDVVASDAHGPTRPPALVLARRALSERRVDAAAVLTLTHTAPRHLLLRGIPRRGPAARAAVPFLAGAARPARGASRVA
jgi:protein-tyrosine phosphatase